MTRLEKKLAALKSEGRKGLFIYITAGAPDIETSVKAMLEAERAGADVIELGIPFSDPLADGPVIQESSVRAIRNGMTVEGVLKIVREIRKSSEMPLVAMGYINNLLSYGFDGSSPYDGFEKFVIEAKAAGLDGVILPDVPHEESSAMREISKRNEFHLVEFITPVTTVERMRETCTDADGFIYCVSNTGVTGVKELDFSVINRVAREARQFTSTPMAVGFGIGNAESAVSAAVETDGVIVGSAVVRRLLDGKFDEAMALIRSMRSALDQHYRN
ncbi:MAG: tryptophan synthase subunit alpha [Selenomonadaceae bacterium]|nr:tryptophan synthase subunit alpha [Selenomonadaceae bacterium]